MELTDLQAIAQETGQDVNGEPYTKYILYEPRSNGDVAVIHLSPSKDRARLGAWGEDNDLKKAVATALEGGYMNLYLHTANIERIDSSVLGQLVESKAQANKKGAKFLVGGLQPRVQGLLEQTRLIGIFECYETLDDALESLDAA